MRIIRQVDFRHLIDTMEEANRMRRINTVRSTRHYPIRAAARKRNRTAVGNVDIVRSGILQPPLRKCYGVILRRSFGWKAGNIPVIRRKTGRRLPMVCIRENAIVRTVISGPIRFRLPGIRRSPHSSGREEGKCGTYRFKHFHAQPPNTLTPKKGKSKEMETFRCGSTHERRGKRRLLLRCGNTAILAHRILKSLGFDKTARLEFRTKTSIDAFRHAT